MIEAYLQSDIPGIIAAGRDPFIDIATLHVKPGDLVLDVGCGNGALVSKLPHAQVHLLDGNRETFLALSKNYENVHHAVLPILPFRNELFDVIYCSHVVEHLQSEDLYKTLIEMDRCLKPGGRLILSYPLLWEGFYDDLSHVRPYPSNVFRKYLCGAAAALLTRKRVSDQYRVLSLTTRFSPAPPILMTFERAGMMHVLLRKFVNVFAKGCSLFGVKRLQKSGETLVMEKKSQSVPQDGTLVDLAKSGLSDDRTKAPAIP